MHELDVDPKDSADQLGHNVDVNLNVYTQASKGRRKVAVDKLDAAIANVKRTQREPGSIWASGKDRF
jgi:hypothetical protein